MDNQKNKVLSVFIVCISVFALISLACGLTKDTPIPTATNTAVFAIQPSVVNPNPEPPKPVESVESSYIPPPVIDSEPLVMMAKGYGQKEQELGYSFMVENPDQQYAYEDSQYQIAVYNADGTVVTTDGGYIDLILPGQQLGIGGSIYLNEGVTAAKVEVQLNDGYPVESELTDQLTTENVVYTPDEYASTVSGVVNNSYDVDVSELRVSAILFNDAGDIVGGGTTYLNFILANSSTGILMYVVGAKDGTRVELYPALAGLYDFNDVEQPPEGATNLVLSKQGFGQDGLETGYGMIIDNPNQDYSIIGSMYHITAYGEDDHVLGISVGSIDLILPDQTLGIGDVIYLDKEEVVARLDIQIKQGAFRESSILPSFTSENVTFIPDEYNPVVTGEIVSPYDKEVTYLRVSAIAFNEAGDIIGGGPGFLNFIPAKSKSAITVNVTVSGVPAKVELYAAPPLQPE